MYYANYPLHYSIYSIKFLDLESGHLFEAGHLLDFQHFKQEESLFCNKTINNESFFNYNTNKTQSSGKSLSST